jgi:metallo-beta-lactamase class B
MQPAKRSAIKFAAFFIFASAVQAQTNPTWNKAHKPFHVYGNTYYVGTQGLSSMLITSPDGHILIDGAIPQAAKKIAANIRTLGFRVEDVKFIVNSHIHFDHAGGIAELQRLSGAKVVASAPSAKVLKSGVAGRDDPQFSSLPAIAKVSNVREIKDGEVLTLATLSLTAHLTPGHTPGGTSWTWKSCEQNRCLNIVYADSLNPIAAKGYLYSNPALNPNGAQLLEASFKVVSGLDCDILITPHPELVNVFGKLEQRGTDQSRDAFVDPGACREYVRTSREKLEKRLAEEQAISP